jgi:hypothetical protein
MPQIIYLATLLLLAVGVPEDAFALRRIKVPTIDTPSGWSLIKVPATGSCWSGFVRRFDFVNLSDDYSQEVTVETKGVSLSLGSCDGAGLLTGNWVYYAAVPSCASADPATPGSFSQTFTIPKGASYQYTVSYACRNRRDGVYSCAFNPSISAAEFETNLTTNVLHRGAAEHTITVTEDRGAVLANIMSFPYVQCNELTESTKFNIQVNGGRAF